MSNNKKILSVLLALIMALSVFTSVPLSVSAAVYTPPEGFTPESNKIYFDTAGSGWDMSTDKNKVAFYISGGDFETEANPTVPLDWGSRDLICSRVEGTDSIFEFDPAAVNYTFTPGVVYQIVFVTVFKRAWSYTEITDELDFTVDRLGHVASCSGRKEDTNVYEVHWDDEEYEEYVQPEPTEPETEPEWYNLEYKPYGYYDDNGETIEYVVTDPTRLVICGCSGNAKDIVIPETIDGLPVTRIGREAFQYSELKSVTIPDSVEEIQGSAFYQCPNLTQVVIPDSVESIGGFAFGFCPDLADVTFPDELAEMIFVNRVFDGTAWYNNFPDGLVYYKNKAVDYKGECPETLEIRPGTVSFSGIFNQNRLKKLILPEGLQSIKKFGECTALSEVTIPATVTEIGDGAFIHCTALTEIVIPDSVTKIGDDAFKGCVSLTKVTIPAAVTEIGKEAFRWCSDGFTIYGYTGSCAQEYADENGIAFVSIGTVESPSEAPTEAPTEPHTAYGDFDYYTASGQAVVTGYTGNETNLEIPSELGGCPVVAIGFHAFDNCTSLTEVTIPDTVTVIGDWAFFGCSSLSKVALSKNLERINDEAFGECTSLTEITIPDSVTEIYQEAFMTCTSLSKVTLSENLQKIYGYAFSECTSLVEITIPASVTEIGDDVFSDCSDDFTIYGCTGSVAQEYAEEYGFTFVAVDVASTEAPTQAPTEAPTQAPTEAPTQAPTEAPTQAPTEPEPFRLWYQPYGYYNRFGDYIVTDNTRLLITGCNGSAENVVIPEAIDGLPVVGIFQEAFSGNDDIKYITIPDSVVEIQESAFSGCDNLTEVVIPESVTLIDTDAFCSCTGLTSVKILSASPVTIGMGAFGYCTGLTSIELPDSVASIHDTAFSGCTNLSDVTFPDELGEMIFEENVFKDTAWYNNLPDGVVYCGSKAVSFKGECPEVLEIRPGTVSVCGINSQDNLKKLILPEDLQSINGFMNCTELSEVAFPDSVTSIGRHAFSYCGFENVTLSAAQLIEVFRNRAFFETPWWRSIPNGVYYAGNKAVGYKGTCPETLEIRPGTVSVDIYYAESANWFGYLKNIIFPEGLQSISGFNCCSNLRSVTIPASVTEFSVNFGDNDDPTDWKGSPFEVTVYGYPGSAAERISELNDEQQPCGYLTFVPLVEKTAESGVMADLAEDQELLVTDSEKFDQSLLPEDTQLLNAYDISIMQDGEAVYSDQLVTVKIPCRYPDAKVYYQDETYGILSLIDMNAEYKDGYLIFKTAKTYCDTYAVTIGAEVDLALCGDADGDGSVTSLDVTTIQRVCASMKVDVSPDQLMNADVNGDGEVDIIDVTYIQRYLANIAIPYPIGERV